MIHYLACIYEKVRISQWIPVFIFLKATSIAKYNLAEQNFSYFFPDDPPTFIFSPASRRRGRPPKRASTSLVSNSIFNSRWRRISIVFKFFHFPWTFRTVGMQGGWCAFLLWGWIGIYYIIAIKVDCFIVKLVKGTMLNVILFLSILFLGSHQETSISSVLWRRIEYLSLLRLINK